MTIDTGGLRGDYALDWDSFVGQDKAKTVLRKAAGSARLRGVPMPHTLLASGTPGIGKTNLAILAANEVGGTLHVAQGKLTPQTLRSRLVRMRDGDVLFIDEVHTLVRSNKDATSAAFLLNFMQDGVLLGPLGPEEAPRITIMAATTDMGRLPAPLIERFKCKPELQAYTDEQAAEIAMRRCQRIFPTGMLTISQRNAAEIARAAVNGPRLMGEILENVRDTVLMENNRNWLGYDYDISISLDEMGLTFDGLNGDAQRYLVAMLQRDGGPVGKDALVDALREPGGLAGVERVLITRGFLATTGRGRVLTGTGLRRAAELEDAGVLV